MGGLVDVENHRQPGLSHATTQMRLQCEAALFAATEDTAEDVDLTPVADGIESLAVCVDDLKDSRRNAIQGPSGFT